MNQSSIPGSAPPQIPDHELLERIGRGSYGEVWRARTVLGSERAVKIVRREAFEDERPFDREFAGIRRYEPISRSYEGLVHVLHVGLAPDGSYFYYSMELADDANAPSAPSVGGTNPAAPYRAATLASLLQRQGALPVDRCLDIALQLAAALRHLHALGLVHRDIKPSNVILVGGRLKLADLGLVTAFGESRSLVGTEGYLAPEGGGTRQADLFSLGRVIYEMATGNDRLEFPNLPAWWLDHPERPRLMEFNEIFARACAHDPAQRYADAAQMLGDLAMIQGGRSVRRLRLVERRLQLVARAAFGIAVVGCLALAAFALQHRQTQREREMRGRVEQAEREARSQLYEAEKARARAEIHGDAIGRRAAALASIERAAAVEPSLDLRHLAVAALGLPDLRPAQAPSIPAASNVTYAALSPRLQTLIRAVAGGRIERVDLASGNVTASWTKPGDPTGRTPAPRWFGTTFGGVADRWAALHDEKSGIWIADPTRTELFPLTNTFTPAWVTWEAVPGRELCLLGYRDRRIDVFDLSQSNIVHSFACELAPRLLEVSPDGQWVAVADGRDLAVFALASWRRQARLRTPDDIRRVVWSSDSRRLATGHLNTEIHIWDRESATPVAALRGHNNQVMALTFLDDGRWAASSGWDGTLRLWDVFAGREIARDSFYGERFEHDPDSGRVALRRGLDTLEHFFFDRPLQPVSVMCREPQGAPHPRAIAIHPGGRWFAVASERGVPLFDLATGRELAHLGTPSPKMFRVAFEPDGRGLIAAGPGSCVRWSIATSPDGAFEIGSMETYAPGQRLGDAVLSPDGKVFAISHDGSSIHVQEARAGGRTLHRIPCDGVLLSLDISPDGRWLAAGAHHHGWARVWDLQTGQRRHEFQCAAGVTPRFSPDSRFLLTCSSRELRLWNLATGEPDRAWPRPPWTGLRGKAEWSGDGRLFAFTRGRGQADLLSWTRNELLCSLPVGDWEVACLTTDPSGNHVIVGRDSGELEVWNLPHLRQSLRQLKLDWDPPGPTPATVTPLPPVIRVISSAEFHAGK